MLCRGKNCKLEHNTFIFIECFNFNVVANFVLFVALKTKHSGSIKFHVLVQSAFR